MVRLKIDYENIIETVINLGESVLDSGETVIVSIDHGGHAGITISKKGLLGLLPKSKIAYWSPEADEHFFMKFGKKNVENTNFLADVKTLKKYIMEPIIKISKDTVTKEKIQNTDLFTYSKTVQGVELRAVMRPEVNMKNRTDIVGVEEHEFRKVFVTISVPESIPFEEASSRSLSFTLNEENVPITKSMLLRGAKENTFSQLTRRELEDGSVIITESTKPSNHQDSIAEFLKSAADSI